MIEANIDSDQFEESAPSSIAEQNWRNATPRRCATEIFAELELVKALESVMRDRLARGPSSDFSSLSH